MASLFLPKFYQFSTDSGTPLDGGLVYFYLTTTTTPKNTYPTEADAIAGTNANSNPVVLDSDGRPPNEVWITGRYQVVVKTAAGVTISSDDPVEDVAGGSSVQGTASAYGGNNTGSANALAFAFSPAVTALVNGTAYRGRVLADNTGPVTLSMDGTGTLILTWPDGTPLVAHELKSGGQIEWTYNSTGNRYELQSLMNPPMLQGTHTIPVLAGSMTSRVTNGPSAGAVELVTNKVMVISKDFDQTTSEGVQFYVPMAKSWNEGTITAQFGWTAASGTGTVTWTIAGTAFSDTDPLDAAFGTAQSVTDTLVAANDLHITSVTSAVTIAGTPAEGDMVIFQITRDIADTLTADAKLLWVKLFLTYVSGNDN